jgi:hypothetical protein
VYAVAFTSATLTIAFDAAQFAAIPSLVPSGDNLVSATVYAQLVVFAKRQLDASDSQVALLYAAGSAGVVLLSLAAGPVRRRLSFSVAALGALALDGLLTVVLAATRWYWAALVLWPPILGLGMFFNVNTSSLRQQIVPDHLLGRVISIAGVLAWSAIPVGALAGGWAIEQSGSVALVHGVIGALVALLAIAFSFGPVGHADRYLPAGQHAQRS